MNAYGMFGVFCVLFSLYSAGRLVWWIVDKWEFIKGPMGQRFTLSYLWGFWLGRPRR